MHQTGKDLQTDMENNQKKAASASSAKRTARKGAPRTGEKKNEKRVWQPRSDSRFDLKKEKTVTVLKNFAPEGESLRSVRFDGDKAYVCTAIVQKYRVIDPVFFFDLSDPMNITYKETEPIDGFSSSLVNFENGNLLGIGRTNWSTLKVEIYKEGTENVESVCKFELENVEYSTDYKSYYIDRKEQIVGIPIVDYQKNASYYLVLSFDGTKLSQVVYEQIGTGSTYRCARGFFADDYFYIFGDDEFAVKQLNLG